MPDSRPQPEVYVPRELLRKRLEIVAFEQSSASFETARRAVGRYIMSCRCEMRPNLFCLSLPARPGRSAFSLDSGMHYIYCRRSSSALFRPILNIYPSPTTIQN